VADLSSISFQTSVAPFLGPVLALLNFVGRLIGSNFRKYKRPPSMPLSIEKALDMVQRGASGSK
jgi:hypothetical protein